MKWLCSYGLVFCLTLAVFLGNGSLADGAAGTYQAIVDQNYSGADGELIDQVKVYKTVGKAIEEAPVAAETPYVIYIKNGRYYEKLRIEKPFITLKGEERDKTVLTFDAAAGTLAPSGKKYGTSGSGTLIVRATNFRAENITIENGFDYLENAKKTQDDPTKNPGSQAVALKLEGLSDKAVFRNIKLLGFQDTLYVDAGRSYFSDCYIAGHVDFIFGAGRAVFNHCDIVSLLGGYVTAPSTKADNKYGLLIINSRLLKGPQVADDSVYLGRPWHPGGNPEVNSETVYINCYMDSHISYKGWDSMSGFTPEVSRFYEYGSTGPGAKASPKRPLLTSEAVREYSIEQVLGDWNPGQE